jgi:hypothetical protein
VSAGSETGLCEIPASGKSDTIGRKFSCRSFRTARYWRRMSEGEGYGLSAGGQRP